MTYAISDIHGEYERFLTLLDRIHFGPDDTLYILGDLVDRGPQPMQLIQDIAARDNVRMEVLTYHEFGKAKWAQCGMTYTMSGKVSPDARKALEAALKDAGIHVVRT